MSVCSTANGYIIFGFANGLQSHAPEFTKKAVQSLAATLATEVSDTGVTLLENAGTRMYKHQVRFY